jgi:hypothetical protein
LRPIPDALLLTTAQIAATLIGLLLVAVFFYLETGFRRLSTVGPEALPFLKATAQLIVLQYSMVLGLSLGLVALQPLWVTLLFLALSLGIVVGLVDWTRWGRALSSDLRRAVRIRPLLAWPIVLIPLALPVVLGGWEPDRDALSTSLFLEGAVAFGNTVSLLLLAFDLAAIERAAHSDAERGARRRHTLHEPRGHRTNAVTGSRR